MQERFAAVWATIKEYTLPLVIPKNTSSPYSNSDESDDGPPSPRKTDATEMKIEKSLENFIEAMPFLEPLHYGFKLQGPNQSASCFCSSAKDINPWRRNHGIVAHYTLCGIKPVQAHNLLQHCESKDDDYHKATTFILKHCLVHQEKNAMPINRGIKHAAVHHEKSVDDQSRKTVDANKQISDCHYHPVKSEESDHVNKVNEDVENKANDKVGDLVIHDDLEENDASTSIEQELHADVGVSDNVELDRLHAVNNAHSHSNSDSDEQINVGNQANDVQAEYMFADSSEMKDTSMPFEQELLVQCALDSVKVNTADKATDANGHPSKDSDDRIGAENMNVDQPNMIHDGSKTNDTNAE
jgi:hypothetical protein